MPKLVPSFIAVMSIVKYLTFEGQLQVAWSDLQQWNIFYILFYSKYYWNIPLWLVFSLFNFRLIFWTAVEISFKNHQKTSLSGAVKRFFVSSLRNRIFFSSHGSHPFLFQSLLISQPNWPFFWRRKISSPASTKQFNKHTGVRRFGNHFWQR